MKLVPSGLNFGGQRRLLIISQLKSTSSDWKHTKADFDKARVGLWIELE